MNNKKQAGFGVVEIVVAVLIVAVLAYGGYRLYGHFSKPAATNNTGSNQTGGTQAQADPYVGWKTYCDTLKNACFKYPSNWVISAHSGSAIVKSPDASLEVDYSGSFATDGRDASYYIASIDDLAQSNTSWKIVGRVAASASAKIATEYQLVDASLAANLTAGQTESMVDSARFTFKDKTTGQLVAYNGNADTNDAATLLLIEKSFYLQ
ncbi:MAG TPA: prepilin-type N-terminal cleavage/methylation domain-containing protein [Candidatus Acidoferrum sp.]|nr:prepilin-type N-terminal cleavage/methylation domain-containing protein [Candidatus Acidoferrum sp.]